MKSRISVFLLLLGLSASVSATNVFGQITIRGTVEAGDGGQPSLADVHVGKYGENRKASTNYECAQNGTFEFTVPEAGIYSLRVSAVDHQELTIPLALQAGDKVVDLEIRLKPNLLEKNLNSIAVIGDWNNFDWSSPQLLTQIIDGAGHKVYTTQRTATGDTLSYQVLGATKGSSINGTQADYFIYDGGGDYRSVFRTHRGNKIEITFDPSLINYPKNDSLPIVTVKNRNGSSELFLQKTIDLSMKVDAMRNAGMVMPTHAGPVTMSSSKAREMGDFVRVDFQKEIDSGDTLSAQFAGVIRASQYSPNSFSFGADEASQILNTVPASSPFWVMAPEQAWALTGVVDSNFGHAYRKTLENNPEKSVRGTAFCYEMIAAHDANNDKEWRRLYDLVKNDYDDVPMAEYALIEFNPDALVQVGKHVPPFEVTTLDGKEKVSDKSMLGKYYMIDFWATWCGPCVGEMPSLHSAYEKFKGKKGFDIVSLSMDASESQIAPFRTKWKMPWINAFIPGVWDAELAKKFEVASIPKPILVGPDGTIVAMAESLRGDQLEKTLSKYLGVSD